MHQKIRQRDLFCAKGDTYRFTTPLPPTYKDATILDPSSAWCCLAGICTGSLVPPTSPCCSIEGWIHSQRRNRFDQKLVKNSFAHTQTWSWGRVWTTLSITVGYRACHRWARWLARRGTRSLSPDSSTVTHTDLICSESRLMYPPITCTEHLFLVISDSLLCEID